MTLWLLPALLLLAEPALDVELAAAIELDQQKAQAELARRFGDKKSSELTTRERRELIDAQARAEQQVLEKHGVDAKTWARSSQTRSRQESAEIKALTKVLAAREAEAKQRAELKQTAPEEIPIQRGISEDHPVILEETEGAQPIVEQGLPPEAAADEEAAREADAAEKPKKPAKKHK